MLRATLGTASLRVIAIGLNLLVNLVMARLLGVDGYGVFAVIVAWSTVLGVVSGLGFERLLVRELASMRVRGDWGAMRTLLRVAARAATTASLAAAIGAFGVAVVVGDGELRGTFGAMALGALVVPMFTLTAQHQGALQGLHAVARGQVADTVVRPGVLLLLALLLLALLRERPPPVVGSALLAVASAAALGTATWLLRLVRPPGSITAAGAPRLSGRRWLRAAIPLTFLATAVIVSSQADVVIVGLMLDRDAAGAYAVAARASLLVSFPLTVLNAALAPTFASLIAAGDRPRLQRLVTLSVRGATAATLIIALAFIAFADPILALFGPGFEAGAQALTILSAGQLVNALIGPTGLLMVMSGNERSAALAIAFGAGAEILLAVMLIPFLGLVGAATASSVGLVAWNVLLVLGIRRTLGVRPTAFGL